MSFESSVSSKSSLAHLLLIEDEPAILHILEAKLQYGGFTSGIAETGMAGLDKLSDTRYDGVVMDMGLPDFDGALLIKMIRAQSNVPIVVVSGHGTEQNKITALDLGADDYVGKPFLPGELLARLRAVLRRRQPGDGTTTTAASHAGPDARPAAGALPDGAAGSPALEDGSSMAPLERKLLSILEERIDKVVTLEEITSRMWDEDKLRGNGNIRVLVAQIRRKLVGNASGLEIYSVRGVGYRLARRLEAAA